MKICIIYGHHNTRSSFNAAIRDTFIEEAKKCGHQIDLINLFDEKYAKRADYAFGNARYFPGEARHFNIGLKKAF